MRFCLENGDRECLGPNAKKNVFTPECVEQTSSESAALIQTSIAPRTTTKKYKKRNQGNEEYLKTTTTNNLNMQHI